MYRYNQLNVLSMALHGQFEPSKFAMHRYVRLRMKDLTSFFLSTYTDSDVINLQFYYSATKTLQ